MRHDYAFQLSLGFTGNFEAISHLILWQNFKSIVEMSLTNKESHLEEIQELSDKCQSMVL